MDVAVAEALGWKRYGATRHGQPIVVLVGDMVTLYDRFILSQGDETWRETQDPLTADGARMVPRFSTDMAAAWLIVERMPFHVEMRKIYIRKRYSCKMYPDGREPVEAEAATMPEAICRAALLAVSSS